MTVWDFMISRSGSMLYSFLSNAFIILILHFLNIRSDILRLICICSLVFYIVFWGLDYLHSKKKYQFIHECMERLKKKYYIADVMPKGLNYQDQFYRELIRRACKCMMDDIKAIEKEKTEYEEYIANWVHEAKTQITAIQLLCANEKNTFSDKIKIETKKLEINVERIMYFSKSGDTWRDYVIKRTSLNEIVEESVMNIYQILIINHAIIENELKDEYVYNDSKWSSFIVTQILLNCVKYKKKDSIRIRIYSEVSDGITNLVIEDNGIGIKEKEIDHIFEKGYVGSNGRGRSASSGMGMYICKKLCKKLDIGISASSEYGKYTKFILSYKEGAFCIQDAENTYITVRNRNC